MPKGVIPAWVAEMDFAVDPVVLGAVQEMLSDGITGYPIYGWDPALAESYADWSERHFAWAPDPAAVHPVSDVTAGVRLALDVFSEPGGVVFPTPGYDAQFGLATVTGRDEVQMPLAAGAGSSPAPSSRASVTSSYATGRGWSATRSTRH